MANGAMAVKEESAEMPRAYGQPAREGQETVQSSADDYYSVKHMEATPNSTGSGGEELQSDTWNLEDYESSSAVTCVCSAEWRQINFRLKKIIATRRYNKYYEITRPLQARSGCLLPGRIKFPISHQFP